MSGAGPFDAATSRIREFDLPSCRQRVTSRRVPDDMKRLSPLDSASAEPARLGAELRDARQALGLSIEDLAQSLRIRRVYLAALEEGRVRDLPALAYAVGFVRTYARSLGLDENDMVRRFREASGPNVARKTDLVFPEPVPDRGVPAGAVILLGAVLAIGAYVGWYQWSGSGTRTVDAVPPPPPAIEQALREGSPPETVPEPAAPPPGAPSLARRTRPTPMPRRCRPAGRERPPWPRGAAGRRSRRPRRAASCCAPGGRCLDPGARASGRPGAGQPRAASGRELAGAAEGRAAAVHRQCRRAGGAGGWPADARARRRPVGAARPAGGCREAEIRPADACRWRPRPHRGPPRRPTPPQ